MNTAAKKRVLLLFAVFVPVVLFVHQLSGSQEENVGTESREGERAASHQRVLLNVDSYSYDSYGNTSTSQSSNLRVIVAAISANTPQVGKPFAIKQHQPDLPEKAPPTTTLKVPAVPATKSTISTKLELDRPTKVNVNPKQLEYHTSASEKSGSPAKAHTSTPISTDAVQTSPSLTKPKIPNTTQPQQINKSHRVMVKQNAAEQPIKVQQKPTDLVKQAEKAALLSDTEQQKSQPIQANKLPTPIIEQKSKPSTQIEQQQGEQHSPPETEFVKQPTVERRPLPSQTETIDYFRDWPSSSHKGGCPDLEQYKIKDKRISAVLYMADNLDSLPTQTFLSIRQFTRESGYSIDRLVLAYTNNSDISTASHVAHIDYIKALAGNSIIIYSASAETEWQAKKKGLETLKTDQVLVIDDTMIVNRGYLPPLLSELQKRPKSLIYPHSDSLVAWGIYNTKKDNSNYMEQVVWEEASSQLYNVTSNWQMSQTNTAHIVDGSTPVSHLSAGLTGQVVMARKEHLLYLLSLMKTDDVVELSILSWLCGDGVVTNKCSAVVRGNYRYLSLPVTRNIEMLQTTYGLSDSGKTTSNTTSDISPIGLTRCKQRLVFHRPPSPNPVDLDAIKSRVNIE